MSRTPQFQFSFNVVFSSVNTRKALVMLQEQMAKKLPSTKVHVSFTSRSKFLSRFLIDIDRKTAIEPIKTIRIKVRFWLNCNDYSEIYHKKGP